MIDGRRALVPGLVLSGGVALFAPTARAEHPPVGLLAPASSRIGDELERELTTSRFVVVRSTYAPATARPERESAKGNLKAGVPVTEANDDTLVLDVAGGPPSWPMDWAVKLAPAPVRIGVVVTADDKAIVVMRTPWSTGAVKDGHMRLTVEPNDCLARRRACLTVVEYARALGEEPEAATPTASEPPSQPPAAQPARRATDPAEPALPPSAAGPDLGARAWSLGVATTLDLNAAVGEPTGHLQVIWFFPSRYEERLVFRIRALWPLVGAQFQTSDAYVRMWTFGAAAGVQYFLVGPTSRFRPFIGAGAGARVAILEATSIDSMGGHTTFTPSINVAALTGLSYVVSTRFRLFLEFEGARDHLPPFLSRSGLQADAANSYCSTPRSASRSNTEHHRRCRAHLMGVGAT